MHCRQGGGGYSLFSCYWRCAAPEGMVFGHIDIDNGMGFNPACIDGGMEFSLIDIDEGYGFLL